MKLEILLVVVILCVVLFALFTPGFVAMARGGKGKPAKPEKPPKPPKPPKRQDIATVAAAALFGAILPAALTGCGVREAVGDTQRQQVGEDFQESSNSFSPHMATFDVPYPVFGPDGQLALDQDGKAIVKNKSITFTRGGPSNRRVVTAPDDSTIDVTSNASATNYASVDFDEQGRPKKLISDGMFDLSGSLTIDPATGLRSLTWNYSSAAPVRAVNEQYKDFASAWNVATPAQKEQLIEANRERTKQAQIAGEVVSQAWRDFLSAAYPPAAVAASLQAPKSPIDPAALK